MIASRCCCRFVGCTSMMWISRSTTSQRCSIGLRSGDCGDHLSKVNTLSCSRNQSEIIWALWHGALSCWSSIRRWVYCSHKGMNMISNNTQVGCGVFNDAQLVLRGQKCAKKLSPASLHHHHQSEPSRQGRIDPCFHVLYTKFWLYHLNDAVEIETHQTRQRFSNLLLSNFGEPVWICLVSLRFLFLADRSGTRCGLLLLKRICFRVQRVVCSEMVFCITWLWRVVIWVNRLTATTIPHSKSLKSPFFPILMLGLNFSKSSSPRLDA